MSDKGLSYDEAIDRCYDNGMFAWLASWGQHAASDDYPDIIETLKRAGAWEE